MARTKSTTLPTRFVMQKKPVKPKRMVRHVAFNKKFKTLKSLIDYLEKSNISANNIILQYNYYPTNTPSLFQEVLESDTSFNKKIATWNAKVKKYEKWLEDNKEHIKEYERLQSLKEVEKLEKQRTALEKKHQKMVQAQRNEMDKLEKVDDELYEKKKELGLV